ncbi:hypothetical protein RMATCC62417_00031 [Rhizopus microsporus]|nr:hypothetical protein RMATCC62417_00031 [Rhizopus microsporus]
MDDDDTFLPDQQNRLKAQIKILKERLAKANEKQKRLKRELLEEDISYLVVTKLANTFTDPTITAKRDISNAKQDIFNQMRQAVKNSCIQEMISYHRLCGRTIFNFKKNHVGIRLETFYDRTYKEPYYLLFLKDDFSKVDRHTLPPFIPIHDLEKKFMPHNTETFIRIVHDCVQAYVTRREQLNEINKLTEEGYDIKILSENMSKSNVDIKVHTGSRVLRVNIKYENKTSAYPTQVSITDERGAIESTNDYEELKERLMYYKLADTLQSILAERTNTEDIMIE